jgi:molybdopterin converting factor small subunit
MPVPKPPAGHFNVLYFASARSYTSKDYDCLPAPLPLQDLASQLEQRYRGLQAQVLNSCLITVNLEYVDVVEDGTREIREGDEVAIIPPVSSG